MLTFDEQDIAEIPVVVLDTETTGLHAGLGNRMVEIGAVRFEQWREVGQINTLLHPDRRMEAKASEVNGIRDQDLLQAPPFAAILPQFLSLIEGALLVAHNALFDSEFVGMELYIAGYPHTPRQPILPNPWLCTLQLARRHFYFGQNKLEHVAARLGVRLGRSHRALNDVYTTAEVLKRMVRELRGMNFRTVGDLLHAQGGAIYTPAPAEVELPEPIHSALQARQPLRILYLGLGGESERIITPRYTTRYQGSPYLVAYCHLRDDMRSFRLDRIFSAELLA